jgi:hypothetical protein
MARAKSSDAAKARAKTPAIDEINRSIDKLQTLMAQIEDLCREGFPYREAVRARTELALRETIRRVFGEKSDEYQRYKDHKLRATHRVQSSPTVAVIKQLVTTLEQQRSELLGLASPRTDAAQASVDTSDKPILLPISPAEQHDGSERPVTATTDAAVFRDTTPATTTPPTNNGASSAAAPGASSMAVSTPTTTSLPPASSESTPHATPSVTVPHSAAPNTEGSPAAVFPPMPPTETPHDVGRSTSLHQTASIASIKETAVPAATEIVPSADPVDQVSPSPVAKPSPRAESPSPAESLLRSSQTLQTFHSSASLPPSLASSSSQVLTAPVVPAIDPVEALRKICARFHLVARQLRLRRDGRPTLEVEDELDVQDLFGTLLKLDFDEVALDDGDGREKETGPIPCGYRLHHGRVAVIARKTRPGITARELAEQVKGDSAYYSAQADCRLLLCFIYDPEGRIGNPRAFESDLTMVSDSYTLDVVVAPK